MSTSIAIHQPRSTMNAVLWIVQVVSGIFWCFTGFGKFLCFNQAVWNAIPKLPWFFAVPRALFVFIGICEFLGGVGLILPAITGVKPKLTPLAACGLTLIMVLAAVFHIARGESNFFVSTNLVLGVVTAFVAYGRWFVRPITPASPNTFRVVMALAVLGALALGGYVPIWYQMTHPH